MMRCKNCDVNINEDEDQIVEAIINFTRQFCHLQCFRCGICNELLTGLYFEKNGILYCRKDYYNKYAERCQFCRNFMSGPVMVVGSEIKFHPECFKCEACSSIIGDDESYAYVDRSKLYCNQCFQRHTNELAGSHRTSVRFQKRPSDSNNAIQVIEIPPLSNGRQRRIKLALRDYHCCNLINCSCNNNSNNRRNGKLLGIGPVNNNSTADADATVATSNDATKTDGARLCQSNGVQIKRAYCLNNNNRTNCNCNIDNHNDSCDAATSQGDNSLFLSNASLVSVPASSISTTEAAISAATVQSSNSNSNGANGVHHISEIDVNYDLDLLHIGDRILEVNGISIKDKSLVDIEKLIEKSRDQVIHLTVEHNQSSQSQSSSSISTSSSPSSSSFLSDLILSTSDNYCNESFDELNDSSASSLVVANSGQKLVDYCDDKNVFKIIETLPVTSTSTIITTTTAKVSSITTTTSPQASISYNNLSNNSNLNNLKLDKLTENFETNSSAFNCRYANISSDNHNTLPPNSSDTGALLLTSNNNLAAKPSLRPNSLHATTGLDSINSDSSNGALYPPITPSKSMDNTRKSRSLEKRIRNRERSSSLSRLIESIRLTSDNTPSDLCDSSLASPITSNNSSLNTLTSSYFTPSRNGFPSPNKLNNSLSRTKSFRVEPKSYRVFRATDLVKGSMLGKGFFGEVFEVTDKVTKEKMVLKELHHNDREAEANFVREVSILKSLNHKNVLHFIGILYRGKKLNLITEYITGGTLRQLIQDESRPIYWPERFIWARDIASGVNYLHSMNLIHRDLNSQNCLVRDDGTVVVADFGLSKITSVNSYANQENNENGLSHQQMQKLNRRRDRRKRYTIVGNPFWMAPEMMHRNKYDERVDIYSFGIILLEVIGSVNADPDVLKRNRDFSVDKKYFLENYVKDMCPEIFWQIAFLSTEMNPDMRPPFNLLERWLQQITTILDNQHQQTAAAAGAGTTGTIINANSQSVSFNYNELIPSELMSEVINYNNNYNSCCTTNGSSNCLTNNNVNNSCNGNSTTISTTTQTTTTTILQAEN